MSRSPFEPIFNTFTEIPSAFQVQFLQSRPVRLEGIMHRVWHKPILRPMFWLLGKFGILVGKVGNDIPTKLVVEPTSKGQLWRRTLHFDQPVQFNSLNTYNPKIKRVMEWVGPGFAMGMIWNITLQPPNTLLLVTSGWILRLGRIQIPVPNWLWPWTLGRANTTQHADESKEETIHVELVIDHALFGEMFSYSGTFRIV
jgi:hypothetical protein